jgi:hypothetical protein
MTSASTAETVMGTIESGKTKTIPMSVMYNSDEQYAYKKISITITDQISKKTWEDSVSVRFYTPSDKWYIPFYIRASSSVSGIIISPKNQTYRFSGADTSVKVSWAPGDYLVVFSGATADTEAIYSFGVYTAPADDFSGFIDLGNYEPNDTEQTAVEVSDASVVSYLHKNDIDYYHYKIPDPEDAPVLPDSLSLDESLAWLDQNAQSGCSYTITLHGDETIGPKTLSYGGKPVGITLSGGATEQTVSLSSGDSLFTVESGVTLTLDNNITTASLITVNGGRLVMNAGSKISGNTYYYYYYSPAASAKLDPRNFHFCAMLPEKQSTLGRGIWRKGQVSTWKKNSPGWIFIPSGWRNGLSGLWRP